MNLGLGTSPGIGEWKSHHDVTYKSAWEIEQMASSQMFTVQFLKKNRSKQWKNKRYAACNNIKSIVNANWSSKQNNKLAIRLKKISRTLWSIDWNRDQDHLSEAVSHKP